MIDEKSIIAHTAKWLKQVVIKNNFCPFAATEVAKEAVRYHVVAPGSSEEALEALAAEWEVLDQNADISTTLLLLPDAFSDFMAYLDFLAIAEALLREQGYEGVYQLASFHPDYRFAGSTDEDAANYTNRAPYPMIHILREDQLKEALDTFANPEQIPLRNIDLCRKLGLAKMQEARKKCME